MSNNNKSILVVSFGTSYNETREKTIGAIEKDVAKVFPEYRVRRAFTSPTIVRILKQRDGIEVDSLKEALDRAAADGVRELIVQPTHMMCGFEYENLLKTAEPYRNVFEKFSIGKPLLTDAADMKAVAEAMIEDTEAYDDGETAICLIGHGTEADANRVYTQLQQAMQKHYYIGTVENTPNVQDILKKIKAAGCEHKVMIQPLMIVAGDHANHDMAGDQEDSWKSVCSAAGYEVQYVLRGLGEIPAIRRCYIRHIEACLEAMNK